MKKGDERHSIGIDPSAGTKRPLFKPDGKNGKCDNVEPMLFTILLETEKWIRKERDDKRIKKRTAKNREVRYRFAFIVEIQNRMSFFPEKVQDECHYRDNEESSKHSSILSRLIKQ